MHLSGVYGTRGRATDNKCVKFVVFITCHESGAEEQTQFHWRLRQSDIFTITTVFSEIMQGFSIVAIFTAIILDACSATISESFRVFIRNTYGPTVESLLAREDLGPVASFGGGNLMTGSTVRFVVIGSLLDVTSL